MNTETQQKRRSESSSFQPDMAQARALLRQTFGFDEFRPLQEKIINHTLKGESSLVVMPTGGGKSLCYQIPALLFPGLTIVVSPLISLMQDQVSKLRENGVHVAVLNSSLSRAEYEAQVALLKSGRAKLLYLAPESLMLPYTQELLRQLPVSCITIDEAHCISEWGHDFRPEYRQLTEVRKQFKDAVCVALTATATPEVQDDIQRILDIPKKKKFIAGFDRPNLKLTIEQKDDPLDQVLYFLASRRNWSGIIYCFSRKQVDELCEQLRFEKYNAVPYHAGLSERERTENQRKFIRDDVNIVVATIAFGMGIDKPDVRFVIHYDMPQNLESYYQQIGRAGRDGLRAECLMLFRSGDISKVRYFIDQKDDKERTVALRHLDNLVRFIEFNGCRRIPLLKYFGEKPPDQKCNACDNCLNPGPGMEDLTVPAQKILSCIVRTGEMFGGTHLIKVLRGSEEKKVLKYGHEKLSTWGIGREFTTDEWRQLLRQLEVAEMISTDAEVGSIKLLPEAKKVLTGDEQFNGVIKKAERRKKENQQDTHTRQMVYDHDEVLFGKLRWLRKQLADERSIPPYTIFPDRTLMEMCRYFPSDETNLRKIHGVGEAKVERYGKPFLAMIRKHIADENIKPQPVPGSDTTRRRKKTGRHVTVGRQFADGYTIEHLMEKYGVKQNTIIGHLRKFLLDGHDVDPDHIKRHINFSEEDFRRIIGAFRKHGSDILKPIYLELNEEISYEELRIVQLYMMARRE